MSLMSRLAALPMPALALALPLPLTTLRLTTLRQRALPVLALAVLGTLPAARDAVAQDVAPPTGAPAPAAAPEPEALCSGRPAQWLGGSAEASDITAAEAPLSLSLTTSAATNPYAIFRVTGDMQALRLEAQSQGDPALRLETPEGDLLAENDDAVGLDSRIEQSVGPGDYCVMLMPIGAPDMTATVALSRPEMPALLADPVDTTITACTPDTPAEPWADGPLEAALPVRREVAGGVAYLRFTLQSGTPLTLRATSEALDPTMVLFDATGAQVAANDDADGLNARLDFPAGLTGDYCLGVAPISAGEGVIAVTAEALDRVSYLRDAWRRGELAPGRDSDFPMQDIDLTTTSETVVLHDGSAQWLRFTLATETALRIGAHGQLVGVAPRLALFGADGGVVAQTEPLYEQTVPQGPVSLGPVVLAPGEYRLAVTDVNRIDQTGAPIRPVGLVFDRFERVR